MSSNQKSKRKAKYKQYFSSKRLKGGRGLICGLRGFLLFCNNSEKEAIREGLSLLNSFTDSVSNQPLFENEDIESQMDKEKKALKNSLNYPFSVLSERIRNIVFIKSQHEEDPLELLEKIHEKINENSPLMRTRFLIRLVPIQMTCKAFPESISEAVEAFLKGRDFKYRDVTTLYSIAFKARYNETMSKEVIYESINSVIDRVMESKWKVDYKNPIFVIVVEVIKNICCFSFVKDYVKYKKFNLKELYKVQDEGNETLSSQKPSEETEKEPSKQMSEKTEEGQSKETEEEPSKQMSEETEEKPSKQMSEETEEKPSKQMSKKTSEGQLKEPSEKTSEGQSKETSEGPSEETSEGQSKETLEGKEKSLE